MNDQDSKSKPRLSTQQRAEILGCLNDSLFYAQAMTPFPVKSTSAVELVLDLVGDPQLRTWVDLTKEIDQIQNKIAVHYRYNMQLIIQQSSALRLRINSPQALLPFCGGVRCAPKLEISAQHPALESILRWTEEVQEIESKRRECLDFLSFVIRACKTPGQIKLTVPDIVPLLPPAAQQAINKQLRRSRWPYEVDMVAAYRERQCSFLARCVLLKNAKGGEEAPYTITLDGMPQGNTP